MRTTVAIALAVSVLFVGVIAMSQAAQDSEATAMNASDGGAAYNTSVDLFTGVGEVGGQGVVFFGVAAIVLSSLGLLWLAGNNRGRR